MAIFCFNWLGVLKNIELVLKGIQRWKDRTDALGGYWAVEQRKEERVKGHPLFQIEVFFLWFSIGLVIVHRRAWPTFYQDLLVIVS